MIKNPYAKGGKISDTVALTVLIICIISIAVIVWAFIVRFVMGKRIV